MKTVVFIGAGNVATHLAVVLYKHGFDILQVYSRTLSSATELADRVSAEPITDTDFIVSHADLYIFSLKDSVLEETIYKIEPNDGLWVHTGGSIEMSVFGRHVTRYGVLYPFQTFSKSKEIDWSIIPMFIEASSPHDLLVLETLSSKISTKVLPLSTEERKYLHLTGVFACNFTNHMYALAKSYLDKINLPFDVVLPLIDETCDKVHYLTPDKAQTGPAVRYDSNIIQKHIGLIEDENLRKMYEMLSASIYEHNKTKK